LELKNSAIRLAFFYNSQQYDVDIQSAYALNIENNKNAHFCIRYEAINKSHGEIEKFYWPMVPIQMDKLRPQQMISVAPTRPPGKVPTLEETWVYSFLHGAAKSNAYQKKIESHYRLAWWGWERSHFFGRSTTYAEVRAFRSL
jgi:hypothetical protein